MKSLITGVAGFAGSHLARRLAGEGHQIIGIAMPGEPLGRIADIQPDVDVRFADVCEPKAVAAALGGEKFDRVFHLAALASVPATFAAPEAAFCVNTLGTVNVLAALRANPPGRIVYVSSADVYGQVKPDELPIRETQALKPASPYAASKAAAEVACLQFWRTYALPVVIVRPFNHTGPGQGPGFAPSDFAAAIARIEKGLAEPQLPVGNLESRRDYSDVRDIVRAYALAAEHGRPGEVYNVSSGRSVRIGEILAKLISLARISIDVVEDPARLRPSDTPVVEGDSSAFTRLTGWKASLPLDGALADLLEWWRGQV
jgi:GDP-4-dehydro-6-deoxy-D-mannose reductase